jgi:phosphatidylglycerol:prolipoprotein diacylglycerol transferase
MSVNLFAVPLRVASPYLTILNPGFVWSVALLAALVYAVRSARRSGLDARAMYWGVVGSILVGLWGSHLLSLFVHGWSGGPLALFQFMQGGKSLYGGLLAGGLTAGLYFHYRKLPVLAYADAAMPALALGYAVGRIGCLVNGDDYGTLTSSPWAVVYPPGTEAYQAHLDRGWISPGAPWSLPIHPVQLYASLLGLTLFLVLARWRPDRQGSRFCSYLVLYGVGRFLLEYFRGDFRSVLGPFSLPQVFSVAFVFFGAGVWLHWVRNRGRRSSTNAVQDPVEFLHMGSAVAAIESSDSQIADPTVRQESDGFGSFEQAVQT